MMMTVKSNDGKKEKVVTIKTTNTPDFLEIKATPICETVYFTYGVERGESFNDGLSEIKKMVQNYFFKD